MIVRLCQRPSFIFNPFTIVRNMSGHRAITLDASPPIHRGMREALDKSVFHKSITVVAAKVDATKAGIVLKSEATRGAIMNLPKIKTVIPSEDGDQRLILFRFPDEADLSQKTKEFLQSESATLVTHTINLDYEYWTADEILHAILPEELTLGAPTGFAAIGHIAHLNLNTEYLPYKHIIGQIILDKNVQIRTVVNKLDSIATKFRVFKMELLAGEPDYIVKHSESGCSFMFDFSQVYWNSRLSTEHGRLVDSFSQDDVIADVFAGVGPFAVPAAKKGCAVLANDLNPYSYKYLSQNAIDNKVSHILRSYCEDGRDFIRSAINKAVDESFPPVPPPKPSKTELKEERRQRATRSKNSRPRSTTPSRRRNRVTQFIMNLPDTAIEFLDAFRGVLSPDNIGGRDLSGLYDTDGQMPMVHCYCFTRELVPDKAEADIRQRAEERLGHPLEDAVTVHFVRSVAPNKDMYCISFRLPRQVMYGA